MTCCVIKKPFLYLPHSWRIEYDRVFVPARCYTEHIVETHCVIDDVFSEARSVIKAIRAGMPLSGSVQFNTELTSTTHCTLRHVAQTVCYDEGYIYIPRFVPPGVSVITHKGWNAYAVARSELLLGKSLRVSVARSVHGVFIGLAPASSGPISLSHFAWGLAFDASGIKVLEYGRIVATLSTYYTQSDDVQISYVVNKFGRREIRYHYNNVVVASSIFNDAGLVLFPYAFLYSSGDAVLCATYVSIPPVFASANTIISSSLLSSHRVGNIVSASCRLPVVAYLYGTAAYFSTLVSKAALSVTPADTVFLRVSTVLGLASELAYSYAALALPTFGVYAEDFGIDYVPATPARIEGFISRVQIILFGNTTHTDIVAASIPPFVMLSGEFGYSFVQTVMASFEMIAVEKRPGYISSYTAVFMVDNSASGALDMSKLWDAAYGYRVYIK